MQSADTKEPGIAPLQSMDPSASSDNSQSVDQRAVPTSTISLPPSASAAPSPSTTLKPRKKAAKSRLPVTFRISTPRLAAKLGASYVSAGYSAQPKASTAENPSGQPQASQGLTISHPASDDDRPRKSKTTHQMSGGSTDMAEDGSNKLPQPRLTHADAKVGVKRTVDSLDVINGNEDEDEEDRVVPNADGDMALDDNPDNVSKTDPPRKRIKTAEPRLLLPKPSPSSAPINVNPSSTAIPPGGAIVTASTSHKLGPKAGTGAINEKLRSLDRTSKQCRKWQKTGIKIKSFTGRTWTLPRWRTLQDRVFGDIVNENGGLDDPSMPDDERGQDPKRSNTGNTSNKDGNKRDKTNEDTTKENAKHDHSTSLNGKTESSIQKAFQQEQPNECNSKPSHEVIDTSLRLHRRSNCDPQTMPKDQHEHQRARHPSEIFEAIGSVPDNQSATPAEGPRCPNDVSSGACEPFSSAICLEPSSQALAESRPIIKKCFKEMRHRCLEPSRRLLKSTVMIDAAA